MLPLPLLLGLMLALGVRDINGPAILDETEISTGLVEIGRLIGAWTLAVLAFGLVIGLVITRRGRSRSTYRLGHWWVALVEWSSLAIFAWTVLDLNWPAAILGRLGIGDTILLDELVIIAPFLLMQAVTWLATYPASRALHLGGRRTSLRDHVSSRLRQCVGMMLPLLVIYALVHDLMDRWMPGLESNPIGQLGLLAFLGSTMLLLAPLFLRLSWKTRRLEAGPLRRRLEHVSQRFGFKCSDILVWETGSSLVNAGVTGALPWFRYVILTDGLIERLAPREIEAVFGHELGHIKHRHLSYFGFFFVGSVALLSLMEAGLHAGFATRVWSGLWSFSSDVGTFVEWGVLAVLLILYIFVVFGYLSRRFERQADLFGCQVVSCDRTDCPPHADLDAPDSPSTVPTTVCPVGIEIFSKALREVALSNGLSPRAPSWRHGSIAHRLGFLERVANRPETLPEFQKNVWRLRLVLGLLLGLTLMISLFQANGTP